MKKDNKTIVNKIIPDFNPSNQNFSGAGSAYPHNVLINGKEIKPWPFNNKIESGTPTKLPISYYETYDATKIESGYLTVFSDVIDVLYYKLETGDIVRVPNTDYKWDGEILRVYENTGTNTLSIEKQNQPTLRYNPHLIDIVNFVKITANENSTLTLENNGGNTPVLQYSTDGAVWQDYTEQITINKGSSILLKGNNPDGFNFNHDKYSRIDFVGDVSISGNIMGLLDNGAGTTTEIPNDYCFYKLFISSVGITSVSKNFLPATTLKAQCYYQMFNGCSNLRNAPDLPAMELTSDCYRAMFYGCTSLKEAPELPATTLAVNCYYSMFFGCTSLLAAPNLPATTLAEGCYQGIFNGCSSLFSVKIAYTGNFADTTNAFNGWLLNTPSYGIIYYNGSDTATGRNAIPTGWLKVTF